MQTAKLNLHDAPPIEIPVSFFLTAPLFLAAAGTLVLFGGADVLANRWMPVTLAAAHLGTLGFISMVMLGAMLARGCSVSYEAVLAALPKVVKASPSLIELDRQAIQAGIEAV